jgi:hypothetical protein
MIPPKRRLPLTITVKSLEAALRGIKRARVITGDNTKETALILNPLLIPKRRIDQLHGRLPLLIKKESDPP